MSGASREQDRRKQEAAQARMRAAGFSAAAAAPKKGLSVLFVLLVLVVAVGAGLAVYLYGGDSSTSTTSTNPTYQVALSGGVVTLGNTGAPVKVDIYEDYLCPTCKAFSDRDHDALVGALNDGKITVKFHPLAVLNTKTTPAGYSTRAANAALCAAEAGIFPAYHDQLFAQQPAENSAGLTDAQLIAFGTQLGAPAGFDKCVTSGPHASAIGAETKKAAADKNLQTGGQFSTPTVVVGGKKVSITSSSWLDTAISGG